MNTAEVIKEWLGDFDSVIDVVAIDPVLVKNDKILRRLFELAFPPKNLPPQVTPNKEDYTIPLNAIKEAHEPYYDATTTTKSRNLKSKNAKTSSKLVLKLRKIDDTILTLRDNGLVKPDAKMVQEALSNTSSRKRRSGLPEIVDRYFKSQHDQKNKISQIEALMAEAKKQGDKRMLELYEQQHRESVQYSKRYREQVENDIFRIHD